MKNKVKGIALMLFMCVSVLCVFPCRALAENKPDLTQQASLKLQYAMDGSNISDVTAKIYCIANINEDITFTFCNKFENYKIELNHVRTVEEWDALAQTLAAYCAADGISPDRVGVSGKDGVLYVDKLQCGMYLIVSSQVQMDGNIVNFSPALVSLPNRDEKGEWYHDVTVVPKGKQFTPSDDEVTYKVIKHWKNDNAVSRPKNIEIAIVKDGKVQSHQILSSANNWTYSWSAKDDGSVWSVVEVDIPNKYTVTTEKNNTTFIVTNTGKDPQVPDTGDENDLLPYILLMALSGMVLILFGMFKKKFSKNK